MTIHRTVFDVVNVTLPLRLNRSRQPALVKCSNYPHQV